MEKVIFQFLLKQACLVFTFNLYLHIDDIGVLRTIQNFLGNIGNITSRPNSCRYNITVKADLYNILKPLIYNNLLTTKNLDAKDFFTLLEYARGTSMRIQSTQSWAQNIIGNINSKRKTSDGYIAPTSINPF